MIRRICVILALLVAFAALADREVHQFEAQADHGWIRFWGNGTIKLQNRGTLFIRNLSGVGMKLEGTWGEVENIADGKIYTHWDGSAEIIGRGAHVEIRGWNLKFVASGQGKAAMQGVGTWKLDGETGPFPANPDKWKKLNFR